VESFIFENSKNRAVAQNSRNNLNSLMVHIARRDRKIIKGQNILRSMNIYSREYRMKSAASKEMLVYVLSNSDMNLLRETTSTIKAQKATLDGSKRSLRNFNNCKCDKISRSPRRGNVKYLIMANVQRTRIFISNSEPSTDIALIKRDFSQNMHTSNNLTIEFQNVESTAWKRRQKQSQQQKLIYLNYIIEWNKARHFIDYIEDDEVDKDSICRDIKYTVSEIKKAQNMILA
jgi:hypothetical protein